MIENYFKDHIKGDTFNGRSIVFLDLNNNPFDLTDVEVLIQFKYNSTDNEAIFEFKTEDNTVIIPNPLTGEIYMMPRIIDVKEYNYIGDIQFTYPNGVVKTRLSTFWKIKNDTSR